MWLDDGTRTRRRWVVLLHAHVPMLRLVAIVASLSQTHERRRYDRRRLPHPNSWFGDGAVAAFLGRKPPPVRAAGDHPMRNPHPLPASPDPIGLGLLP